MKTKTKSLLTKLCLCLMCVCFILAMFTLPTAKAVDTGAQEADFCVQDKVSVRTVAGSSGIRFQTRISKEFYETNKDGVWGSIIGYEIEDASRLTLDNLATLGSSAKKFEPTGEDKIVPVQETDDEGNVYYYYNTVIVYDKLTDSVDFAMACKTELNVRSYVTVGENTTYSFVDENSKTYHSISKTAERALVNDKALFDTYSADTEEAKAQKSVLQKYIVQESFVMQKVYQDVAYSYDMYANEAKSLTGIKAPNGTYKLTVLDGTDSKVSKDSVEVVDGVITLPADFMFTDCALGNTYTLSLTNSDYNCLQPFKYVSKVISTADDFLSAIHFYPKSSPKSDTYYDRVNLTSRYYVLSTSITDVDVSKSISGKTASYNAYFNDILDGQGNVVTFSNVYFNQRGIFGQGLNSTSVIKNIGFVTQTATSATTVNNTRANNSILATVVNGTWQNVYIDVNLNLSAENMSKVGLFSDNFSNATFKDVYINIADTVANPTTPEGTANRHGYVGGYIDKPTFNNVYVVKNGAVAAGTTSGTVTLGYAYNESVEGRKISGLFRHNTVAEMLVDGEYGATKVGDWTVNDDGTATWSATAEEFTPPENVEIKEPIVRSEYIVNSQEVYVSADSRSYLEIACADMPDGIEYAKVFFDGNLLTYATVDVANKKIILKDDGLGSMVLGGVNLITIKTEDESQSFVKGFRYIHKEIKTAADFNAFLGCYSQSNNLPTLADGTFYNGSNFTQRYYVLANDISVPYNTKGRQCFDILDGQGYTLSLTNWNYYGLFERVHDGAVVKNLGIVTNTVAMGMSAVNKWNQNVVFARYIMAGGRVENIYIDVNYSQNTYSDAPVPTTMLSAYIYANSIVNNVYINVNEGIKLSTINSAYTENGGLLAGVLETDNTSNVYFVSPTLKEIQYSISANNSNVNKLYAKNEVGDNINKTTAEIYRYDTTSDMISAGVKQVGNWAIQADGTAKYVEDFGSNEESYEIIKGGTLELNGDITDAKSSNTDVITVDGKKITAVGVGKAVVEVTENGKTYLVYVEVKDFVVAISKSTFTVEESAEISLTVDGKKVYSMIKTQLDDKNNPIINERINVVGNTITATAQGNTTIEVVFQVDGETYVREFTITVN